MIVSIGGSPRALGRMVASATYILLAMPSIGLYHDLLKKKLSQSIYGEMMYRSLLLTKGISNWLDGRLKVTKAVYDTVRGIVLPTAGIECNKCLCHIDIQLTDAKVADSTIIIKEFLNSSLVSFTTKPTDMDKQARIERISRMEDRFDEVCRMVDALNEALGRYEDSMDGLEALKEYMGSGEWKDDYEADEAGQVPSGIKRGVLSEDGLYNLLDGADEAIARARKVFGE